MIYTYNNATTSVYKIQYTHTESNCMFPVYIQFTCISLCMHAFRTGFLFFEAGYSFLSFVFVDPALAVEIGTLVETHHLKEIDVHA